MAKGNYKSHLAYIIVPRPVKFALGAALGRTKLELYWLRGLIIGKNLNVRANSVSRVINKPTTCRRVSDVRGG